MQISDKGTGVFSMLSSHLRLVKAEVSQGGRVEERTYRRFGLTIRRRRILPEQPEMGTERQTVFPAPASEDAEEEPDGGLVNLARSVEAEDIPDWQLLEEAGTQAERIPAPQATAVSLAAEQGSVEQASGEDTPAALSAMQEEVADAAAPPDSQQHPILSGKTLGVVGFSPQEAAVIGQALAAQYCSFSFLSFADAEFRKGAIHGCDLLIVAAAPEWSAPGSLHPASLLKTKKPLLLIGQREALGGLALRSQGGPRELVPTPWDVGDMIWRASTLLGRVQEPRSRNGKKNQRKRIVIGDESAARALVHAVLAQEGMECHVTDNGVDTVSLARSKQADAVIVDVSLPGLDGFQVLAEIRRDPTLKDAAVILLTARQSEADVLRGFGLGADDYVTKPFSPMELAARLKRLLLKKP